MDDKEKALIKSVQELQVDIIHDFIDWYTIFSSDEVKKEMSDAIYDFVSVKAIPHWIIGRIEYVSKSIKQNN